VRDSAFYWSSIINVDVKSTDIEKSKKAKKEEHI